MILARHFFTPFVVITSLCIYSLLLGSMLYPHIAEARHPRGDQPQDGGKARIEQLKKLKLIEILDLDEATAEKFFLRYNTGQKKVEEARKLLDEATNELEKSKAGGNSEKIKQQTEAMLQKHKNLQDATNEMLKSIRGVLSEKQYAEFLVFEAKFPEILRKSLQDRKDSTRK